MSESLSHDWVKVKSGFVKTWVQVWTSQNQVFVQTESLSELRQTQRLLKLEFNQRQIRV